jgi:hypothetical protein
MRSLDTKLLLLGSMVWILMAIYYLATDIMIEGARVWAAGSVIFFIIFLSTWYAERRGEQKRREGEPQNA